MSVDKSLKSMDFMTNASESTAHLMCGDIALIFSIISPWPPSLMTQFSVCMEASAPRSMTRLTKSDPLTENNRFLTMEQCAI